MLYVGLLYRQQSVPLAIREYAMYSHVPALLLEAHGDVLRLILFVPSVYAFPALTPSAPDALSV